MPALTFVFKAKKRFVATFTDIVIDKYDPGTRLIQTIDTDGIESFHKDTIDDLGKVITKKRHAVLCIVRHTYTGEPFAGIAVIHPNELEDAKKPENAKKAKLLAARRACRALASVEYKNSTETSRAFSRWMFDSLYLTFLSVTHDPDLTEDEYSNVCSEISIISNKIDAEGQKNHAGKKKV